MQSRLLILGRGVQLAPCGTRGSEVDLRIALCQAIRVHCNETSGPKAACGYGGTVGKVR